MQTPVVPVQTPSPQRNTALQRCTLGPTSFFPLLLFTATLSAATTVIKEETLICDTPTSLGEHDYDTLLLENCTIELDAPCTHAAGTLLIQGIVEITGPHFFTLASTQKVIIAPKSTLRVTDGATLYYAPGNGSPVQPGTTESETVIPVVPVETGIHSTTPAPPQSLTPPRRRGPTTTLVMSDRSSTIELHNACLRAAPCGLHLLGGQLWIYGSCEMHAEGKTIAEGIRLGDGKKLKNNVIFLMANENSHVRISSPHVTELIYESLFADSVLCVIGGVLISSLLLLG